MLQASCLPGAFELWGPHLFLWLSIDVIWTEKLQQHCPLRAQEWGWLRGTDGMSRIPCALKQKWNYKSLPPPEPEPLFWSHSSEKDETHAGHLVISRACFIGFDSPRLVLFCFVPIILSPLVLSACGHARFSFPCQLPLPKPISFEYISIFVVRRGKGGDLITPCSS